MRLYSLFFIALTSIVAVAAENTITIEARSAQVLGKNTFTYSGDVVIRLKNATLHADKVSLRKSDAHNTFEAHGNPAHWVWTDDIGENRGNADTIILVEGTSTFIEFKGNAHVSYRQQQVNGHIIRYDFDNERLDVSSTSAKSDKVHIILQQ